MGVNMNDIASGRDCRRVEGWVASELGGCKGYPGKYKVLYSTGKQYHIVPSCLRLLDRAEGPWDPEAHKKEETFKPKKMEEDDYAQSALGSDMWGDGRKLTMKKVKKRERKEKRAGDRADGSGSLFPWKDVADAAEC